MEFKIEVIEQITERRVYSFKATGPRHAAKLAAKSWLVCGDNGIDGPSVDVIDRHYEIQHEGEVFEYRDGDLEDDKEDYPRQPTRDSIQHEDRGA